MNTEKLKSGFFSQFKYDFPSSVVVFLVAMPLCLGIALASGAPLFSGVISGIVGGIVVSLLSGSPLGVSGPAAGLAVIVYAGIQELQSFEAFLLVVVIAGIFQVIFGLIKAGVVAYYFPTSVIKGMLSGIGIIIIIKEIPFFLGIDKGSRDFALLTENNGGMFTDTFNNFFSTLNYGALIIALASIAILVIWEQGFMKRLSFTKMLSGPLMAVLAGIGLANMFMGNPSLELSPVHLVNIPSSESLAEFAGLFSSPDFSYLMTPKIYILALSLAAVASIESLLCSEATDKLDPQKRITPVNKELVAQGVGNIFAGMLGGIPVVQVIVRSSANIQSGGKTRASSFMHGILLLICVFSIPNLLNMIPLASLAAILIVVGYKLAKPAIFREMFAKGKPHFIPYIVTILGIIFTDLLTGIGLGMAVAFFNILYDNYRIPYHVVETDIHGGHPFKIRLSETVSFLNKGGILHSLNQLPDGAKLIIDASKTNSIHPDVVEMIEDFKENAKTRNISVEIQGMTEQEMHSPVEKFGQVLMKHADQQFPYNQESKEQNAEVLEKLKKHQPKLPFKEGELT
ncbi:MAG: SulP family inorganic anion transporter [Schleiferiaceae bacterium]|jgi:MFS superfamily sulfate permease-like transporter|nr:SulP family inorganic anion transporter [Schleiferiaceae bacterium]